MPRNRELMRVFKDVGLVEQLGSGMSRILKMYDKSIFYISEHFIKVEFPFSVSTDVRNIASGGKDGDKNGDITRSKAEQNRVLELLRENPAITAVFLAEKTGFSTRKISRIIKELRVNGLIVRVGSARKGYWEMKQ